MGHDSKTPEIYRGDELREVRSIPEKYMFDTTISLDGDLLSFFVIDDGQLYVITLESSLISKMFQQLFLFIWDQLEPTRDRKLSKYSPPTSTSD